MRRRVNRASVERARSMHRQAQARYHARLRERAMALLGGRRCQECGLSEMEDFEPVRLEFAHVAPTKLNGRGRGAYHRLRDVEKNPEAYRLLCRPCHMDLRLRRARPMKSGGAGLSAARARGGAVLSGEWRTPWTRGARKRAAVPQVLWTLTLQAEACSLVLELHRAL